MANYTNYTNKEMQAITIARAITNDHIAIVGTGLPLIGATVAKKIFSPGCTLIVESGLIDCDPIQVPTSVGDCRFMAHCAVQWPPVRYIGFQANEWLKDRDRMIAFSGGAEIDPYGNVNSTSMGDYNHPTTRFSGSGGANGIATYVDTVLMMQHEKRRFTEKIDYITSPGWMDGGLDGRKKAGLPQNRGPLMVVTDKGVMKFDETTKRMYLAGYYESSSIEEIVENTGFEIDTSRAELLAPPSPEVIKAIREEIDPGQVFIKVPKE